MLDRVVHNLHITVLCAAKTVLPDDWQKYRSKNHGRESLQLDLGIALLNYAITYDVSKSEIGKIPTWVRQRDIIPCDCIACYFCINDIATGIYHMPKKKRVVVV